MDPEDYEHLVAQVLSEEGWDARVTPYQRDFGVDIIAERAGVRLGVQVKMFGNSNRPVAGTMVMQLYGAAAYADCDTAMIVTDGRILADAGEIAKKLGIEIRVAPASAPSADIPDRLEQQDAKHGGVTFGQVWREHVVPLAGSVLALANGKSNEIPRVDDGGRSARLLRLLAPGYAAPRPPCNRINGTGRYPAPLRSAANRLAREALEDTRARKLRQRDELIR